MSASQVAAPPAGAFFTKSTLERGQPREIRCVTLEGQVFCVSGGPLTVARLEDEWYEDLANPELIIERLKQLDERIDLFTFWQRMPDVKPLYPYHLEWEEIAVLPVTSYEDWFTKQIKSRVRNQLRKAEKEGLVVRETRYDDAFVKGMTRLFNESPVRQGRKFWHYGKSFETVKEQFSRYVHREWMLSAEYGNEMIGLMMLGNAGRFALTGQILSSLHHRDKAPNNALIAKAVESCAARGLPYLIYLFWSDDSLAEFKRRCGFERVRVPRYYVPITWRGELALRAGAHRGVKAMLPPRLKASLKQLRTKWHGREQSAAKGDV
jgi:hypothetical protein